MKQTQVSMKQVFDELQSLKKDVNFIKKHMIDVDMILTEDDKKSMKEAEEEYAKGETTSLEDIKTGI
jgi:hypothetical protein